MWDILNDRSVGGLISHSSDAKEGINTFAFSEGGAYVVAFSKETNTINIAETATGTIVGRLPHPKGVKTLDINYDGSLVVSIGKEDNIMRVWTWNGQPRVISELKYYADSVAISRDGKYVATRAGEDSARVWDISQPGAIREVARIQPGEGAEQIFFNPDARHLLTSKGSVIQVWRWQVNQLMCEATNRLIKKDLSLEDWAERKYVLPNERHFLNAQHRPVISCEIAPSRSRQ